MFLGSGVGMGGLMDHRRQASEALRGAFGRVGQGYARRCGVGVAAVRGDGTIVLGRGTGGWDDEPCRAVRRLAVEEALRWGECCVQAAGAGSIVWGVPIMRNAELLGGLVAGIAERRLFRRGMSSPSLDVRGACADFRRLAESHNLTNAALLESHRSHSERQRLRAEAIHQYKSTMPGDIRGLYLVDEPALLAAIRNGDRSQARGILNRLLVAMLHRAGENQQVIKSFFMELIASMSRGAVEAGAAPQELLAATFDSIAALARIDDDERLAAWLNEALERVMDALASASVDSRPRRLTSALRLMAERCGERISRAEIAAAAQMSQSHFSRSFTRQFGRPFVDILGRMRADRAAELLARSDKPIKLIALECGFADQSHLTRSFRRQYHVTPARYRIEHESSKV